MKSRKKQLQIGLTKQVNTSNVDIVPALVPMLSSARPVNVFGVFGVFGVLGALMCVECVGTFVNVNWWGDFVDVWCC